MGLDCTAYSNLKHVGQHEPDPEDEDWCYNEGHVTAFAYKGFERSTRGLLGMQKDYVNGLVGGDCYATTDVTESSHWGTSYGGHNRWREELARFATDGKHGAPDFWNDTVGPETPFYEVINFADNEGSIGPEAARDLLGDFRTHRDAYAAQAEDYDLGHYDKWLRGCELASQDGLISFH